MNSETIQIGSHIIGQGHPVYVIAEMSGNHNQDYQKAIKIIEAAKEAGADAVKLQTYTADTITIKSSERCFKIDGTLWDGKYLYDLYKEAYTPWEWQPDLKRYANQLNIHLFSSPFDFTAVDFLEKMDVPAYKIASPEIIDMPLINKVAKTGKPAILSTGMASLAEIEEAMEAFQNAGGNQMALLKCTSAYPAPYAEMNLRTIPHMREVFKVPVGLSDHSLGIEVAVAAVSLGACIIEKHLTLSRKDQGPDSAFSMEPGEFKRMVTAIKNIEKALGTVSYKTTKQQQFNRKFRRSLFAVQDIRKGQRLNTKNVRSIRPADGLHTRHFEQILGRKAKKDIRKGTPLNWGLIDRE